MKQLIILFAVVCTTSIFSQNVGINSTGAAPNASAMLDIVSTSGGLLVPRMTAAQKTAITTPATGLLIYQTDAGTQGIGFYFYNGTAWVPFSTNNGGWGLQGNAGTASATNFLGTTDAVDFVTKTNGTERMRIFSTGDISINNTLDRCRLYVYDNVASTATYAYIGRFENIGGSDVVRSVANADVSYAGYYASNVPTTAGTGYGITTSNACLQAQNNGNKAYTFAVYGNAGASGVGRSGGVLGNNGFASGWGSLGYYSSGLVYYGLYYSNNGTYGGSATGTGRMSQPKLNAKEITSPKIGFGMGGYADLMGGWIRGDIYGLTTKGSRYSLYTDGFSFSNSLNISLNNVESSNQRIPSYSSNSMSPDITSKGKAKLNNGYAQVKFSDIFSQLISDENPEENLIITITPIGDCNGIHIVEYTKDGFIVKENSQGTSNVQFNWIAVGNRKGYENVTIPEELLSKDYDSQMNKVMFDENNTNESANPMWWDGSKLIFSTPPDYLIPKKVAKQ